MPILLYSMKTFIACIPIFDKFYMYIDIINIKVMDIYLKVKHTYPLVNGNAEYRHFDLYLSHTTALAVSFLTCK